MLGRGPFYGEAIRTLGALSAKGDFTGGQGACRPVAMLDRYVARIAADHPSGPGLAVAWDAGNGAAGEAMVRLAAILPGRHVMLNQTIDGRFPNHHPDPTVAANLEQLIATVRSHRLDLGLAFDGDGDRIGVVDGQCRILHGDQLLAILARDVLARHPGATIIADVKASQALFDEIARLGGRPLMWRTGHSLIKAKMAETGAPLAGEMSGHVFCADGYYGFDDALFAAARLLRVVAASGRSLAALRDDLPATVATPELRFPCAEERKFDLVRAVARRLAARGADVIDIDGVRVNTADGWWLLRASNTQAVVVGRCEAADEAGLARVKRDLAGELAACGFDPPPF
jgi:phosphomannomutase